MALTRTDLFDPTRRLSDAELVASRSSLLVGFGDGGRPVGQRVRAASLEQVARVLGIGAHTLSVLYRAAVATPGRPAGGSWNGRSLTPPDHWFEGEEPAAADDEAVFASFARFEVAVPVAVAGRDHYSDPFRIRAAGDPQPRPGPEPVAVRQWFAWRADMAFSSLDFLGARGMPFAAGMVVAIPADFTGGHIAFARAVADGDVTVIEVGGHNQVGGFSRLAGSFELATDPPIEVAAWVSDYAFRADAAGTEFGVR